MIYMWVDNIHCGVETDEVGEDEPYIVVAAVDLKNKVQIGGVAAPIPASAAFLYPFTGVDAGETHRPPYKAFWGLNADEKPLATPEDAIFVAGLMENDDGRPDAARGVVASALSATLLQTLGADRAEVVRRLIESVRSALKIPTGFPSTDELVDVQEVRFEQPELAMAETGQGVTKTVSFNGDGGRYSVTFQARNRGQRWRFCAKCHAMFFDAKDSKGRCPAGGGHGPAGFTFFLPHDRPAVPAAEVGWRFCGKCSAMFKQGTGLGSAAGDPGVCPAGGGHDRQGFRFLLPRSHPGPGQGDWTRCGKCRTLFWNGEDNKGVCPAGNGHARAINLQGTPVDNLKLDFEP